MIRNLLVFPSELARLPLAIVDERVAGKLPEASAPRVTLDRALGSADKLAGALLGNRDIAQRGSDRIERSQKLAAATRLEEDAEARREQAREKAATGRRKAARSAEPRVHAERDVLRCSGPGLKTGTRTSRRR